MDPAGQLRVAAKNVICRIRLQGPFQTLLDVIRALRVTRVEIWHLPLAEASSKSFTNKAGDAQVLVDATGELAKLRLWARNLSVDFFRDVIDVKGKCILVTVSGRLAGIAWVFDSRRPGHFLRLAARDLEIRSVHTLREFRGKGVARLAIHEACRVYARRGYRGAFAVIHSQNQSSRRVFEAVGFHKVADVRRPSLFGPRYKTTTGTLESWWRWLYSSRFEGP